jgi:micrococcal nuclease
VTVWTYPAIVIRLVDADTVRMQLDLGLHIWRTDNCRVAGINAPELSTDAGQQAAIAAGALLQPGAKVTFTSKSLDKYGRPLGDIRLEDQQDFATVMVAAGHAVRL